MSVSSLCSHNCPHALTVFHFSHRRIFLLMKLLTKRTVLCLIIGLLGTVIVCQMCIRDSSNRKPDSCNFTIYWDADPLAELLDHVSISKWNWNAEKMCIRDRYMVMRIALKIFFLRNGLICFCILCRKQSSWGEVLIWLMLRDGRLEDLGSLPKMRARRWLIKLIN